MEVGNGGWESERWEWTFGIDGGNPSVGNGRWGQREGSNLDENYRLNIDALHLCRSRMENFRQMALFVKAGLG